MKKMKLATIFFISILGCAFSLHSFAYSENVEKKLEKIDDDIKRIQEKIDKKNKRRNNNNNNYNSSSNSSSNRTQKLQDKITDLQEDRADIIEKENKRIDKAVKVIEGRKTQSQNKLKNLEKNIENKKKIAQTKYDNDKKRMLEQNSKAQIAPFKFSSPSDENMIKAEKEKIKKYDTDIQKIKNPAKKMTKKK